jgi:thymidylate synthase (FAD)
MSPRSLPESLSRFAGVRVPVLDHGFIEVLDVMGDDDAVVEGARVSIEGEEVRAVSDNRKLIRHLFRSKHSSCFEMAEIKLRVKLPIFVARQWIRHRTASVGEKSARYGILPEEFYIPPADQVCYQATDNRQGRAGPVEPVIADVFREKLEHQSKRAFESYHEALDGDDIARETARIGLPLGTYTEWIWKQDLHNLLHFSSLRLDAHAQWEIRQYAEVIAEILAAWVPLSWEAFEDYQLHAHTFSRQEVEILRKMADVWLREIASRFRQLTEEEIASLAGLGSARAELQPLFEEAGMTIRERSAFLRVLGLLS